jgi:hypothetical protein
MLISHFATLLALMLGVTGCVQNIREQSPDSIAQSVSLATTTKDQNDLVWIGPELHISHYRILFYGYDTVDYRLAAKKYSTTSLSDSFVLLVDAHYGGDVRHYEIANMPDSASREVNHRQHDVERCQIFNSLISSCLYRDRFSLAFSRAELERAHKDGLQFILASKTQSYERLDLPPAYIQGFLKAIAKPF